MDSVIFQGNVLGMLAYIMPAAGIFFKLIKKIEEDLVERKLYLACGIGVVLGTIADIVMILGGLDLYSTELGYASMILVSPFVTFVFLFFGVNLNTFRSEPAAAYYSVGFGLFFGGAIEFWRLLMTEVRYPDTTVVDIIFIAGFGFSTVLFLGGASIWIAYGIKNGNGPRVAARLCFLYLFLVFLNASALENIHYNVHDSILINVTALAGCLVAGIALFHQGVLKLPNISGMTKN